MRNLLTIAIVLTVGLACSANTCSAQSKTKWQHKIRNNTDSMILVHVNGPKSQKDYFLFPGEVATGKIWAQNVDVGVVYFGPNGNQTCLQRYDRRAANRTLHVTADLFYGGLYLWRGRF